MVPLPLLDARPPHIVDPRTNRSPFLARNPARLLRCPFGSRTRGAYGMVTGRAGQIGPPQVQLPEIREEPRRPLMYVAPLSPSKEPVTAAVVGVAVAVALR